MLIKITLTLPQFIESLHQARKVCEHVYLCQNYQFCPLIQFYDFGTVSTILYLFFILFYNFLNNHGHICALLRTKYPKNLKESKSYFPCILFHIIMKVRQLYTLYYCIFWNELIMFIEKKKEKLHMISFIAKYEKNRKKISM